METHKVKIRKVGVLSFTTVYTITMVVVGLMMGFLYAINDMGISQDDPQYLGFGFWGVIIFPFIFAIIGVICGSLIALLYNLIAKFQGGIELELEEKHH